MIRDGSRDFEKVDEEGGGLYVGHYENFRFQMV